jgi:hypothetical protein
MLPFFEDKTLFGRYNRHIKVTMKPKKPHPKKPQPTRQTMSISFPTDLYEEAKAYAEEQQFDTLAAAIRSLMRKGLKSSRSARKAKS